MLPVSDAYIQSVKALGYSLGAILLLLLICLSFSQLFQ